MTTQSPRDRILAEVAAFDTPAGFDASLHMTRSTANIAWNRGGAPYEPKQCRSWLIECAAYALAAIEAIDAQGETK